MKYKVLLWCSDCSFGQDPLGCFDGGSEYIYDSDSKIREFDNISDAYDAGWKKTEDCGPWEFAIEDEDGKRVYESTDSPERDELLAMGIKNP